MASTTSSDDGMPEPERIEAPFGGPILPEESHEPRLVSRATAPSQQAVNDWMPVANNAMAYRLQNIVEQPRYDGNGSWAYSALEAKFLRWRYLAEEAIDHLKRERPIGDWYTQLSMVERRARNFWAKRILEDAIKFGRYDETLRGDLGITHLLSLSQRHLQELSVGFRSHFHAIRDEHELAEREQCEWTAMGWRPRNEDEVDLFYIPTEQTNADTSGYQESHHYGSPSVTPDSQERSQSWADVYEQDMLLSSQETESTSTASRGIPTRLSVRSLGGETAQSYDGDTSSIPEDRNTSFLNRVVKPELADNSISSVDSGILKEYKARGNRKPRAKSAPPSCRSWEHLGGIMSKERLMIWEQHNRAIEEYGIASGIWPADFKSKAFPKEGKDFPRVVPDAYQDLGYAATRRPKASGRPEVLGPAIKEPIAEDSQSD